MSMSSRQTLELDQGWGFQADLGMEGLREEWANKGLPNPRPVKVPHTWNVEAGLEEFRGQGWYEYRLQAPEAWEQRRIRIRFEGVYRDATLWLNGEKAGGHYHSGYTAFVLDLTKLIRYGQENVLTLLVDNSNSEVALPRGNSFDWADDGGIIRGVSLIVSGAAAIEQLKVNATPRFGANPAEPVSGAVNAELSLCKGSGVVSLLTAEVTITRQGKTLWSGKLPVEPEALSIQTGEITLDTVDLWHFDHPHLYELKVTLWNNGVAEDEQTVSFGFREIKPVGHELWLNRERVRLIGVEWMPGSNPESGMAESEEQLIRQLVRLKEANCVFTRFHWQQDRKLLDWCDRNGILVQEEIPHWQQPEQPDEAVLAIALMQAEEMIGDHYNHPCIFAWGMGNELDGQSPQTADYMMKFKEAILKLDPHRMINYVSNTLQLDPGKDATGKGDLLMWNDYIGTWHGDMNEHEVIQSILKAYPDKPLVVAEYGLCEPVFEGGDPRRIQILRDKTELYRRYEPFAALIYFSLNDYRTQMGEDGTGRLRQRVHGTLDVYGAEKPSYAALREVSSPVLLTSAERTIDGNLKLVLACRADIPGYTISGYMLNAELEGINEPLTAEIPRLVPGQTAELLLGLPSTVSASPQRLTVTVFRPTGYSVCTEEFKL